MWCQITSVALALLAVTTSARNLLEQQNHPQRELKTEADMFSFSFGSCKCKFTPLSCLFVHGERNKKMEKELQTSSSKFGDMSDHAPCCSEIKYASLDTTSVGWTDENLQETVCNHALSMSSSSNVKEKIIKDTIIVTHSMGTLIVAGAVANKKCSIDKSVSWVSMSAPMNGTMASDFVQDVCSGDDSQTFAAILMLLGKCPVGSGMKSIAYYDGKYSNAALDTAYTAAQKVYKDHVSAAMCSNGNVGLISKDQPKYVLLGSKVDHGTTEHDGFVTYDSCRGGLDRSKFSERPSSEFYVTTCNHADTAFLHGDGISDRRKPVQWFECLFSK